MSDVLINKTYKQYDKVSRYQEFPYYYNTLDDKYVYGLISHLKDTTTYSIHTVVKGDTLDSLALYYYNNPTYFWIIADFNRIHNVYKELVVGSQIKIPSYSDIEFDM